ncbi:uncharacterized protein LOC123877117 [Maniola jurtina]|uniref:uncharacterized protein LOC123877117 n=1 Tax=Maniola jurtina TaxID=191418 RepID=UPI001E688556|nr:uncharacterized protein LOC123877117 [Maniola jurtina]
MVIKFKKKLLYLAVLACCVSFLITKCLSKRMMYFSLERPQVTWFDKEYYSSVIFKSRRLSRNDPVHYVTVNYTSLKVMNNNFTVSLYFYQLLSNVYKRSFVDIHLKFCDLWEKDEIVGDAFRSGYYRVPEKERVLSVLKCPGPPGFYSYLNMKFRLTALMDTFPFQEGRVYVNVTDRGRPTGQGSIDFNIKALRNSKK